MSKAKPFSICKEVVVEAFKRVKANKGAAGVDGRSIADFEKDLKKNLYKVWNRMSSGSYFPSAVRRREIPKADGSKRPLGIPTVVDRIAQTVVKIYLEPGIEPFFHQDSYAYRPGKSAIKAVCVARQRCFRNAWVLDLDIKGFFDNIDHELMMRSVCKHTDCKWLLLYIERWLTAPVQREDGSLIHHRGKGTPQGSVISPVLANLFLHYAFDSWMQRNYPSIPFERYADDIVVHCKSEKQSHWLKGIISQRMTECKLELHPEKTKVVFCKDANRHGEYPVEKFDFLGYEFRPRSVKSQHGCFVGFSPAIGSKAAKAIRDTIRGWRIHRMSDKSIGDIALMLNPMIRGWINYFGCYGKSALYPIYDQLNNALRKWAMRKYKRLRGKRRRAMHWLGRIARRQPGLFSHWRIGGAKPAVGR